jgi:ABC-type transporter MlaC component
MKAMKKPGRVPIQELILTLTVYLIVWASGAQAAGPMEGVKGLIEDVQFILQTKSEKSQRLELIEKIEDHHLDFREMAKRSLQSTWADMNRSQQDEFIEIFSKLMKAHIAKHLDTFAKTKVESFLSWRTAEHNTLFTKTMRSLKCGIWLSPAANCSIRICIRSLTPFRPPVAVLLIASIAQ